MNMVSMAKVQSYNRFGRWLEDNDILLTNILRDLCTFHKIHFHPLILDWYKIAGQMPILHKSFDGFADKQTKWLQEKGTKSVPPWRVGRDT